MTTASLLILLPSADGRPAVAPSAEVAGLPLLRRTVLAAGRAGFGQVLVGGLSAADRHLLADTGALTLDPGTALPPDGRRRVVVLAANVVPQPAWLRRLLELEVEPERVHVDGASVAVIESADPGRIVTTATRCASVAKLLAHLRAAHDSVERPFGESGRFTLASAGDVPAAERWLLRGLIKSSEGFMSRHFERRLSLALTRRLVATSLTPNAMTLVSVGVGLLAAPFFLSSAPGYQLAGALLFLLHSILDGCDGELARLKFLETPRGAVLDFWGDNLVHVSVFACMAAGWSVATGTAQPLFFGGVTILATAWSAATVYGRGQRAAAGAAGEAPLARLANALAHRDFIYVIVVLAAFGKAAWFLVIAAVGTPIFLLLLLRVGRRQATS